MFSLWKNDIRRLREIAVLLSVALVLDFLLFVVSKDPILSHIVFFMIVILGILVIPLANYDYLHDRTKATHLASLPYTKIQVFVVKYCSGLFVLVLPLVLYYLTICMVSNQYAVYTPMVIPVMLLVLLYYTVVCLVANVTGTTWMHGIMAIFVTCIPYALYVALNAVFTSFVRGFVFDLGIASIVAVLFPGIKLVSSCMVGYLESEYMILYSAYFIVVFVAALLISGKRPLENTGTSFSFALVGNILKVIMVIAFSWIITTVVIIEGNFASMIFSNIVITFVLSMLMQFKKGQKIKYKQGIVQTICICAISLTMFNVSSGYLESYIPQNPQSVSITNDAYEKRISTSDEKAIETVKKMHTFLLSTSDPADADFRDFFYIYYHLKNGDVVVRNYRINKDMYDTLIDIMGDSEALVKTYLKKYEEIVKKIQKVKEIQIGNSREKDINVTTESEIETFKTLLSQEVEKVQADPTLLKSVTTSSDYYLNLVYDDDRGQQIDYFYNGYDGDSVEKAITRYLSIKATNEEIDAN